MTKSPIVKYSALVNDDNRLPDQLGRYSRPRFKGKLRAKALAEHKLLFADRAAVDAGLRKFLDKIKSLPAGTFFSVGSLAKCSDKRTAVYLGKELVHCSRIMTTFNFISGYTGKWIYQRTAAMPESVADFDVDLAPYFNY